MWEKLRGVFTIPELRQKILELWQETKTYLLE